jgi:hypothetical protein
LIILKNNDKDNYYEVNKQALEELIYHLHIVLFGYCFERPPEERIKQYNALQGLLELTYPDGNYGKNTFNRLYNYGHLGHLYHKGGCDKKAFEQLRKAAEFAVKLDEKPDEAEYFKRYYNCGPEHRKMSARELMKTVMTEHYHLSEEFKETREFKEILKML